MICVKGHKIEVLESAAGFYIGTFDNGPNCRLSVKYFGSRQEAQAALDSLNFESRDYAVEIKFCNQGGNCVLWSKEIR